MSDDNNPSGPFSGKDGKQAPFATRYYRRLFGASHIALSVVALFTLILGGGTILLIQFNTAAVMENIFWWNIVKVPAIFVMGLWVLYNFLSFPVDQLQKYVEKKSRRGTFNKWAYNPNWIRWSAVLFGLAILVCFVLLLIGTIYMSIFYLSPGTCAASPWCSVNNIMLFWFACEIFLLAIFFVMLSSIAIHFMMMFGYPGSQPWIQIYEAFLILCVFVAGLLNTIWSILIYRTNATALGNVFWATSILSTALIIVYFLIYLFEFWQYVDAKYMKYQKNPQDSDLKIRGITVNGKAPVILLVHFLRAVIVFILLINAAVWVQTWAMTIYEGNSCAFYSFCTLDRTRTVMAFIFQSVLVGLLLFYFTHVVFNFIAYLSVFVNMIPMPAHSGVGRSVARAARAVETNVRRLASSFAEVSPIKNE